MFVPVFRRRKTLVVASAFIQLHPYTHPVYALVMHRIMNPSQLYIPSTLHAQDVFGNNDNAREVGRSFFYWNADGTLPSHVRESSSLAGPFRLDTFLHRAKAHASEGNLSKHHLHKLMAWARKHAIPIPKSKSAVPSAPSVASIAELIDLTDEDDEDSNPPFYDPIHTIKKMQQQALAQMARAQQAQQAQKKGPRAQKPVEWKSRVVAVRDGRQVHRVTRVPRRHGVQCKCGIVARARVLARFESGKSRCARCGIQFKVLRDYFK